jgi:AP-1-like transcription factor
MNNGSNANSFQFEFPRFGGLPGTHMLNNGPLGKSNSTSNIADAAKQPASNSVSGVLARQNSVGEGMSPGSQANTPASEIKAEKRGSTDGSYVQNARVQSNSVSNSSSTDSPSASSVSQYGGPSSSCGTSPEPSQNSPANAEGPKDTLENGYICHGNSEGEITFCEKLNMACGNPRNPVPRALSVSNGKPATPASSTPATTSSVKTPGADANGIDFFATQNDGQFNPVLFGDYRESQNAVMGDGDFTGGFFDDAFGMGSYGSPNFHFGDTPAITTANKPNPLEQIERIQDGDDEEVVPGEDTSQMLNCHKIWSVSFVAN